jgi:hypothetical protein
MLMRLRAQLVLFLSRNANSIFETLAILVVSGELAEKLLSATIQGTDRFGECI